MVAEKGSAGGDKPECHAAGGKQASGSTWQTPLLRALSIVVPRLLQQPATKMTSKKMRSRMASTSYVDSAHVIQGRKEKNCIIYRAGDSGVSKREKGDSLTDPQTTLRRGCRPAPAHSQRRQLARGTERETECGAFWIFALNFLEGVRFGEGVWGELAGAGEGEGAGAGEVTAMALREDSRFTGSSGLNCSRGDCVVFWRRGDCVFCACARGEP